VTFYAAALGQRVWDILRALEYLKTRPDVDASQIRILGRGSAGLAALMAGALDESVRSVLLDRTLATYASIVDSEEYALALDWFVPDILQRFDIPDIDSRCLPASCMEHQCVGCGRSCLVRIHSTGALIAGDICRFDFP
jgi:hypothetical protein